MLRALLDAGVRPDLVVGTSVGAINGAVLAACPAAEVADRLESSVALAGGRRGVRRRHGRPAARAGAHPHRRALRGTAAPALVARARRPPHRGPAGAVPVLRRAHRGRRGALVRPRAGGRRRPRLGRGARPAPAGPRSTSSHYLDGGLVNSIPLGRAVELGAQPGLRAAGRADRAGRSTRRATRGRSASVAFEIARRHRFARDLASAARTTSRCTSCRPATAPRRGGTAGRRCATATSPASAAGSTARTGLRRPTWTQVVRCP